MTYILLDERNRIAIRIEGWSCAREFGGGFVRTQSRAPWSRLLLRILCNIWEITGRGGGGSGVDFSEGRTLYHSSLHIHLPFPFGKFIDEGVISV